MFDFNKKIALATVLLGTIANLTPAMAQGTDSADIQDYLPGILLDDAARAEVDTTAEDFKTDVLFPSEMYQTQNFDRTELYRLYDEKQYNRAVFGILRLARAGDPQAEETVGVMYRFGQGLKVDDEQAHRWFLRASEGQQPLAQHHLGSMYYNGQGTSRNLVRAAMFMQLAIQNYPEGSERTQAVEDLKNISLRLSRIEQEQARQQAKEYLTRFPKPQ
tara:strand:- start:1798 stop:2451 length:654 start_codon:yes stop_codon:yes gene_type:complete